MPLTAGKILYHLWHRPTGWLKEIIAAGGPLEKRRTQAGRKEMTAAARLLPVPENFAGAPLELHLLTGARFWEQTAFCLWTFARHSRRPLHPVIYDDGTLAGEHREPLARLFPQLRFVSRSESEERLEHWLPVARFPHLRERWLNYPNIRKLTDPHLGRSGWKLVLDSDLLFFRQPECLLRWLDEPNSPLHAVDCETSYGYSASLLERLAGTRLAERVNVGLTGLNSSLIDWEKLEAWTRELHEREGTHYYLEQALIAMMVAGHDCAVAPARDYITRPPAVEARACRAVMHHYVANTKRWYFQHCWRIAKER